MLKKALMISALSLAIVPPVFAAQAYLVPQVTYQGIENNHIKYEGITPGLALGYGDMARDWLYLAAEIFGNYSTLVVNNEPKNGLSLKNKWSYGISVLPGFYLEECMMTYFRLGGQYAHFEKIDESKWAYELGVGLLYIFNPVWSARVEYDYARFQSMEYIGQAHMSEVSLGAVYNFDFSS